ncbi:hypothetical protein Vadar_019143 [Vaccinium darrowii]|uniref:Uncharacterized protein n=1 Tax=Vaccinium darrowii TaxID=229202 RepID=A0ACB7ZKE9_9ERIC|nr:hypothetical protein Vadar_019143 [Vaccinium darrowii]
MALRLEGLSVTKPKGLNSGVLSSLFASFFLRCFGNDEAGWSSPYPPVYAAGGGGGGVDGTKFAIRQRSSRVKLTSQALTQHPARACTTMIGDSGFSLTAVDLSPSQDLDSAIAEGSEDSDQLLEEESSEHEIDGEQGFGIESTNFDDTAEQVLGFESNDLGNYSEQVLEFGSNDEENHRQVLEIDSNHNANNNDQVLGISYQENGRDCGTITIDDQNGVSQGKGYPPPVAGMEFESYDDAYHYYNCYAKELGFGIRVKSSWTKRNSKEKRGAVLSCNCEGFKTVKEASSRRKETRTGCLAMIRLRLVESNRWRVDEIKLEHNHLFDPERAQNSKSHKKMDAGVKRKLEPPEVEVRTIKLYRTPVADTISELYTKELFLKFQEEVEMMASCLSVTQVHANGPIITYIVKEQEDDGCMRGVRNFEVMYDKAGMEVRCICSCFNFKGYLCRHALCVLNYNAVEEIPVQYILSRWRKDFKRMYIPDIGSNTIDISNPVQWFDHLYRRAMQVVEEGVTSQDHYTVAWQAFKESLNKVRGIGLSVHSVATRAFPPLRFLSRRLSGKIAVLIHINHPIVSPLPFLEKMDEVSLNSEPAYDGEADEFEIEGDCGMADYIGQTGVIQGETPLPPAVGMEFESYDDVYCFYNCYAKDQGFGVRVSNTWYRKSKERYRGKLSCSSAGFKKKNEANRPRPETRTGCPAMVKFRLMDNRRWRIIEVELEHNHLISPASGKFYKSHKTMGVGKLGTKRPPPLDTSTEEVQKVRLFRTVLVDAEDNGNVYSDDGEFGISVDQPSEDMTSFFKGFLHKCTPLKDFLCEYNQVSQKYHQDEALSDLESRSSSPALKSRFYFELQLSKLYTNHIFKKFQSEVEGMCSCFSRQVSVDGSINTYIVKEHAEVAENRRETRDYEVMYNTSEGEVLCVCGLFNFQGYLCRHALSILNQNGMQEIPPQYILPRWRKDIQRNYVLDHGCNVIDINNPVHMYDHLYKRGVQVVEQGRKSQDCYKFALQALDEILNKVHLAEDLG